MIKKIYLIIVGLIILVPTLAGAKLEPKGYINDYVGVLDRETINELNSVITKLDELTHTQIAVVLVDSTDNIPIEKYAYNLYNDWGIGYNESNGLLLVVALEDKVARVELGKGFEEIISDGLSGRVQDQYLIPSLQNNDINKAISDTVYAFVNIVSKEYGVTIDNVPIREVDTSETSGYNWIGMIVLIFLFIMFLKNPSLLNYILLNNYMNNGQINSRGSKGFGGFGGGSSRGGGSTRKW